MIRIFQEIQSSFLVRFVKLNVGGKPFLTSRSTLTKATNSVLAKMFSRDGSYTWNSAQDEHGYPIFDLNLYLSRYYLLDHDPEYFKVVLNFLRFDKVLINKNTSMEGVLQSAIFFGIDAMVEQLKEMMTYVEQNFAIFLIVQSCGKHTFQGRSQCNFLS